jgi:TP901 family phage tail tape measure protein
MTLKKVGVILVAEDGDAYLKTLDQASDATEKMGQSAQNTAKKSSAFTSFFDEANESVKDFAKNIPLAALSQLGTFLMDSVGAAGDFEAAIGRFGAITGESGAKVAEFSDLFLQMGQDTQYSAQQAADAAVELAKGGLTPAAIAGGALADALNLASAGELELATAAEITAKQLGVWSSAGVTSTDVANLLSQAANASTVGVDDLAMGLANVGGVAKAAGLNFQETVQTMALIAPGFSSAADAGTSFKTLLANLIPSSDSAISAFKQLGLMTQDGANKFYDAQGAFIGMEKATQLLSTATQGLTDQQKNQLLTMAFGSDAIRAATQLADAGAKGYTAMGTSMAGVGTAADQAKARQVGYNNAMEQMRGSLETLQIVIGQKLLPALTDAAKGLTVMVNGLIKVANAVSQFAGRADKLEEFHQTVIKGADGWDQYSTSVDKANDQIPFYMDKIWKLNRQQYEFSQTLIASGMSLENSQIMTEKAREASMQLELVMQKLTDTSPQMASAIDSVSSEYIALSIAGGNWKTQADLIMTRFAQTGDINQYTSAIKELEAQYKTASLASGVQGGGFSASLQQLGLDSGVTSTSMAGLADAAMRYATIAPMATESTTALGTSAVTANGDMDALYKTLDAIDKKGNEAFGKSIESRLKYQSDSQSAASAHNAKLLALQTEYDSATTTKARESVAQKIADENVGYTESKTAREIAYANEKLAQQAHLGEMLIEHMIVWGKINNVSSERIAIITGEIANKYGVAKDSVVLSYADMTTKSEEWALGTETSAAGAVNSMLQTQDAAANAAARQTQIRDQMIADLVAQKEAGVISIDEYNAKINEIPKEVITKYELEVETAKLIASAGVARAEAERQGYGVGTALSGGISSGVEAGIPAIVAAAGQAVQAAYEEARRSAGIRSPSRLFEEGIGIPMADGVINGFIDGMETGKSALGAAIDGIGSAGTEKARKWSKAIADEFLAGIAAQADALANGRDTGGSRGGFGGMFPGRAGGGDVNAGSPYWVGETGQRELFMPGTSGSIAPPAQAAQIMSSYSVNNANNYNYAPTYGSAPRSPEYDFLMMQMRAQL